MKRFRVKVTERYVDYVWVECKTASEAESMAIEQAECVFDCVLDSEVIREE